MDNLKEKTYNLFNFRKWLIFSDGIIIVLAIIISGSFFLLYQKTNNLREDLSISIEILNNKVANLETDLVSTGLINKELSEKLSEAQAKSDLFEESISDIAGTVGTLEKLSKTDKELLQKYSRVYFLSDNYVPMSLDKINSKYLYDENKIAEFHSSALVYLQKMLDRANRSDISLKIVSAYRSFGTQSTLKNNYLTTYGSGANQFSADQGYSEHQLGTAVDLTTPELGSTLTINFEKTEAFNWLVNNAYKYGFILSYPKDNIYYQYEPWHWRFVGIKLATKLHDEGLYFSDFEQREIDKYLVKIFD